MLTEEAAVEGVSKCPVPFCIFGDYMCVFFIRLIQLVVVICLLAPPSVDPHFKIFSSIDSAGGSYMPSGPPSGSRLHPAGYPIPRVPFSPFPGGPPSQPYAIPTRGPVGTGRGSSVGGHLPHQQATQHNVGTIGPNVNFPLDSPNSQPSPGGPLSQPGYVSIALISFNFFLSSSSF